MPRHLRPFTPVLALLLVLSPGGCGGSPNSTMPPLGAAPSLTRTPPPDGVSRSTVRQPGASARLALQRFLRGVGAADPRVCTYVTTAYAKILFGRTGCRAWVTGAHRHLTADELTALRAVQVPVGTPGSTATSFTVSFDQLMWTVTTLPVAGATGPLRTQFVLRKLGTRWLLAG